MNGILYGIGVGPGDPELLTLRAMRALREADVVLSAASSKNEHSIARSIAAPYLSDAIAEQELRFPMTHDRAALKLAWRENAEVTASLLQDGKNVVFLTLGDPLIYSTFGYLMQSLKKICPDASITVIPGITSFQAAAAATGTILCESHENLLISPGIKSEETLLQDLQLADNIAILKAYKNIDAIRQALRKTPKKLRHTFVSRLGLEGEQVCGLIEDVPTQPTYLSLLLCTNVRRKGDE